MKKRLLTIALLGMMAAGVDALGAAGAGRKIRVYWAGNLIHAYSVCVPEGDLSVAQLKEALHKADGDNRGFILVDNKAVKDDEIVGEDVLRGQYRLSFDRTPRPIKTYKELVAEGRRERAAAAAAEQVV